MVKINKKSQDVIDRLEKAAITYGKIFDFDKIIIAMKKHYEALGVTMPEVVVIDNMEIAYKKGAARDAARGAAWDAARDAAWDAARGAAWGAAWDAARGAAWDAARGAAWDAARDAAWDAARDAAWGAAWGAAALNTNLTDEKTLKFISIELPLLEALEAGLGFFFPMQDKLILIPCPSFSLNNKNQLHSEEKMAVEWKDKTGYYFLDGVKLEKNIWQRILTRSMSFDDVGMLKNIEDRMIALKYNPDALLKNGKLLDKTARNELWFIKDFGTSDMNKVDAYFLKYVCPSTGRVYTKGVPPEIGKEKDADAAQAWSHWLSKEAYTLLEIES